MYARWKTRAFTFGLGFFALTKSSFSLSACGAVYASGCSVLTVISLPPLVGWVNLSIVKRCFLADPEKQRDNCGVDRCLQKRTKPAAYVGVPNRVPLGNLRVAQHRKWYDQERRHTWLPNRSGLPCGTPSDSTTSSRAFLKLERLLLKELT